MSLLLKKRALLAVKTVPAVNLDATINMFSLVGNVQLRLRNDGALLRTLLSFTTLSNNYMANGDQSSGIGSFYEGRLQATSGTNPSGPALNVFHNLGTTRTWTWAESDEFDGVLTVREVANPGTNVDTATIDVNDNP